MSRLHCFVRALSSLALFSALIVGQASAQTSNTHEMHVYQGAESVPLRLEGWLVLPPQVNYQVSVISPPSFGQVVGEDYWPNSTFWDVGADRLTLRITLTDTFPVQISHHTFLFSPLVANNRIYQEFTDFDVWPGSWSQVGSSSQIGLSSTQNIVASVFGSDTAWIRTEIPDGNVGGGSTGYGGSGGTLVDPPPIVEPGDVIIASLGNINVELEYYDDPGPGDGYHRVRATAPAGQCDVCETPWRQVPSNTWLDFGVWAGAKVTDEGHFPFEGPWSIRLTIQPLHQPMTTDWIEGDFDAVNLDLETGQLRLGILEPPTGMEGLQVTYDRWITWTEKHDFERVGHVAETFEDGQASDWETEGSAGSVIKTSAPGSWAWAIDVDSLVDANGIDDTVLIDSSPGDQAPNGQIMAGRDTATTALLRVDFKHLNLGEGDSIRLLRGSGSVNLNGGLHLSLVMHRLNGLYRVRVTVREDDAENGQGVTFKTTPWYVLGGASLHDFAVQWRASSADGADDGEVRLWVDGQFAGENLNVDNDSKVMETLAFGAHRSILSNSGSLGTIYFDDLASFPGQ